MDQVKNQSPTRKYPVSIVMYMNQRNLFLILFSTIVLVIYYVPLRSLWTLSFNDELYSHIFVIPLISAYFVCVNRRKVFQNVDYSLNAGTVTLILGGVIYMLGLSQRDRLSQNDYLFLMTFSVVITWIGGFIIFYGMESFKTNLFPFLILFFMVPIPGLIVKEIISLLQIASTEVTYVIFKLTGVPIFREGFIFHLPGLSIEVAEQCSGIRSSIALSITSIIAGKIFLKAGCRRVFLALSVFPIAIMKNGLRIVTLSLLGAYVDERILSSLLHKRGGIPFFFLALSFLFGFLWLLRRSEERNMSMTIKRSDSIV